ncbi:MAG: lipopolysaccharide transport periplasmic protein LptA [Symploca sp. SIO2G7]|nr:lipopolysaccharide transport periplasmic protein LptA [Symploca sp. SIO2G7]
MFKVPIAASPSLKILWAGGFLALLTTPMSWAQEPERTNQVESPQAITIPSSEAPIDIDAEETSYDLRTGLFEFEHRVQIERGPMRITADRATLRQVEGEMSEIELFGNPVEWRDQLEDGSIVNGEANNIFFDVPANIVTLTQRAVIVHEKGQFTGDELIYDLTTEQLRGSSEGDNRVRVRIEPDAMPESGD